VNGSVEDCNTLQSIVGAAVILIINCSIVYGSDLLIWLFFFDFFQGDNNILSSYEDGSTNDAQ